MGHVEFERLFKFGEMYGNDEASQVGYSLELRQWTAEFRAQDYVLEVKSLSGNQSIKRLMPADGAPEAIGHAVTINERIKRIPEDLEPQSEEWWREIVYIVHTALP